uniref:VWFA domain-containing protein n=1 Tax=Chromera velia CCMP2878 TaxID=1169474 RepID=A0A0G4G3J1_9ALVE|eukprot:Cvel_20063.t1-p1 / transcript=Cvel_20063.t1 / gene=Cvel_20063 / organism=Chromera_velia_CCMP2878 / gene_product=hypothetical protein / transcript_product=hypothetical protein / location=Cvel_scaffold1774:25060-27904(-) / protein_length=684 / sequence_SO=supercontig / SO=protein_coding / is_pseudo=false
MDTASSSVPEEHAVVPPQECGNRGVDIVMLIDVSCSMAKHDKQMVDGFNQLLSEHKQKDSSGDSEDFTTVSVIHFNQRIKSVLNRRPIREVENLLEDSQQYIGQTYLYDAIGKTITAIDTNLQDDGENLFGAPSVEDRPLILLAVLTDGDDNGSFLFRKEEIQEMVKKREELGWFFVLITIDGAEYFLHPPRPPTAPIPLPIPRPPPPPQQTSPNTLHQHQQGAATALLDSHFNAVNVTSGIEGVRNLLKIFVNADSSSGARAGHLRPDAPTLLRRGRAALEETPGMVRRNRMTTRPSVPSFPLLDPNPTASSVDPYQSRSVPFENDHRPHCQTTTQQQQHQTPQSDHPMTDGPPVPPTPPHYSSDWLRGGKYPTVRVAADDKGTLNDSPPVPRNDINDPPLIGRATGLGFLLRSPSRTSAWGDHEGTVRTGFAGTPPHSSGPACGLASPTSPCIPSRHSLSHTIPGHAPGQQSNRRGVGFGSVVQSGAAFVRRSWDGRLSLAPAARGRSRSRDRDRAEGEVIYVENPVERRREEKEDEEEEGEGEEKMPLAVTTNVQLSNFHPPSSSLSPCPSLRFGVFPNSRFGLREDPQGSLRETHQQGSEDIQMTSSVGGPQGSPLGAVLAGSSMSLSGSSSGQSGATGGGVVQGGGGEVSSSSSSSSASQSGGGSVAGGGVSSSSFSFV